MSDAQIESAFVYAYPLYALALTRYRAVQDPKAPDRHAVNTLRHDRRLCDAASRWITAPNNDTLYSNAWLDLSQGPVRVQVQAMPEGRYWSVALMDGYTNHVASSASGSMVWGRWMCGCWARDRWRPVGPGE